MEMKVFANNISAMRLEKRWTQEDLAGFLGVSRQAVSKWENASSLPDIDRAGSSGHDRALKSLIMV